MVNVYYISLQIFIAPQILYSSAKPWPVVTDVTEVFWSQGDFWSQGGYKVNVRRSVWCKTTIRPWHLAKFLLGWRNHSGSLTLNTGTPHSSALSPLLYSLFTHDCVARCSSDRIIQFAEDTTVVGLTTHDNEAAYKEEVRQNKGARTTTSLSQFQQI